MKDLKKINKEFHCFNHINENPNNSDLKVSVKDCICVKDMPCTAGSKILNGYIPRFDATCIKRLKEKGVSILGKTSMDAFGFGSFNINVGLDKKVPLNPFDKNRVCGGSSGGAAAFTQLADKNHVALAESTGGSIACPASFCGVYGITPTYGRVSRYGMIDYASSMDKIGVMSKDIKKCAQTLEIISGSDNKDSTCVDRPKGFTKVLGKDCKNLKIGIIKESFDKGTNSRVADAVKTAIKKLNLDVEEVSLPFISKYSVPAYYLLSMTEASTNLAKLCGMRYGVEGNVDSHFNEYFTKIRTANFNKETKRRIIIGTFARMEGYRDAYYLKAAKIRTLIIRKYKELFKKYDILISPSMPIIAPTFDEAQKLSPVETYMMDILTVGPNLAGLPHLNVPCGFIDKMPVGMLLIGDHFNEKVLFQLGDYYENRT